MIPLSDVISGAFEDIFVRFKILRCVLILCCLLLCFSGSFAIGCFNVNKKL